MITFVPHNRITPGLYYIRTDTPAKYTVGEVTVDQRNGNLIVFLIGDGIPFQLEDMKLDQFIRPVQKPFGGLYFYEEKEQEDPGPQ